MAKKQPHVIGDRVLKNYNFIRCLGATKSKKKFQRTLQNANCDELLTLTEIGSNILSGSYPLTKKQKNRLFHFASFIRKISKIRSEKGARKFYKNQQGGQAAIAALLAPILVEAAHHLINKISGNE